MDNIVSHRWEAYLTAVTLSAGRRQEFPRGQKVWPSFLFASARTQLLSFWFGTHSRLLIAHSRANNRPSHPPLYSCSNTQAIMPKINQVRPSSTVEADLDQTDKEVAVDMAGLANLAYTTIGDLPLLGLDKSDKHNGCTTFRCKVFEGIDEDNEKRDLYHCQGIGEKLSEVQIINSDSGADCWLGKYDGNTFVAFRGTEGTDFKDWRTNLKAEKVAYWTHTCKGTKEKNGKRHDTIKESAKKHEIQIPEVNSEVVCHEGNLTQFVSLLDPLTKFLKKENPSNLYITGHSLGGALSSLSCLYLSYVLPNCNIRVYTFGAPRSGSDAYNKAIHGRQRIVASYRFQGNYDPVPHSNSLGPWCGLCGNWVRHIPGGGKRVGNQLAEGEYTLRYKRVIKTDDMKNKNMYWKFTKVFVWFLFDAGSALSFHSQDLYVDKISHEWSLTGEGKYDKWKKEEILDPPILAQAYIFISSFVNVNVAWISLKAAAIMTYDFIWYLVDWDSNDPEIIRCVRAADSCDSMSSDPFGGYGGAVANSSHSCPPTPGWSYLGMEVAQACCPEANEKGAYTCSTDYEKIGYTWLAEKPYTMPYCIHNTTTCIDLKYCAGYSQLNGPECDPENSVCINTPSSTILFAVLICLYLAFAFTLRIVYANLVKLCPGKCKPKYKRTGICSKRKMGTKEFKREVNKGARQTEVADLVVKIYLYYTIVSNEVLEFLDEFLAAGCLDEQGTNMFIEMSVSAQEIYYTVRIFMYLKIGGILILLVKYWGDPPNRQVKKGGRIHYWWT